jgi:hypothetical protein
VLCLVQVNVAVDEHLTNAVNKYDTDISCKTLMDHIQAQVCIIFEYVNSIV